MSEGPCTIVVLVSVMLFVAGGVGLCYADPPSMSPLTFLPGDTAIGTAPGSQTQPVVARGGDHLLAVWTDNGSSNALGGTESDLDIFAARLDGGGHILDRTPIVISRDAGYQRDPQVAWNGQSWLVIWENQTFNGSYYESRVFGARVSSSGQLLDADPIQPLGADPADEAHVTANGSEWLVVTQSYSAGQNGIRGRRIAADGSFSDPAPTMIVAGSYYLFFNVDIDSAGGEYLLTYSGLSTFNALRLSVSLTPLGPVTLPATTTHIASSGTMYYVLFSGGPFGNDMLGSPMSPTGIFTIPGGAFFDDLSDGTWWSHDIAWDGAYWWVAYLHAWTGLTYQRAAANGVVIDPIGFFIDEPNRNNQGNPQLGPLPSGGMVTVWQDSRIAGATAYDIFAAVVRGPNPPYDIGVPISLCAPHQTFADLAAGDGSYLIAYTSALSGHSRILVQRLDMLGHALDAEPIEVASGVSEVVPAVAWNGQLYLCVWNSAGMIVGRRIALDGTMVDPVPVTIMPGGSPDVAALGGDFLVVTTNAPSNPQYRAAFARRVSGSTGQPIDPAPILLGDSFAQGTRVAPFGGRWLVTWQRNFSHDDPQAAIEAAFVDADGTTPGSFVVLFSSGGTPDVAVSDDTALFIWRSNSLANANNYISARRMRSDGSFVDATAFTVSEAPGRQLDPVCAWTGGEFVTAWEDQRNQSAFFDTRTDLYGARVPAVGAVTDPAGYGVIEGVRPVINPTISSPGNGEWLVAASVVRTDPPFAGYRIGLRAALTGSASVTGDVSGNPVQLWSPVPNPLISGATTIRYELPREGGCRLSVVSTSGRLVRRLADGSATAGTHQLVWNGRDEGGRSVSPGVYFIRLEADGRARSRKMVITH